ncbi:zinc finger protein 358 [Cryptotermes secundus]|nr:zinc finger protein 358 [Cryptotermes secundus]
MCSGSPFYIQNLMNEVEVPEGSVFTYRLSNGTHVLVHQSVAQGKGAEELDCDEEVPLLFLEDGQITYNGTGILETQLLDQTMETNSFLLSDKPPEVTSVKTDQTQGKRDVAIPGGPQFVNELNNQQKVLKVEKSLTEENVTLEKLEDFVELVTSYKCRICPFTTPEQQELLQHFRLHHMQMKLDVNPSTEHVDPGVASSNPQPVSEKLIFLCGQCNNGFASLEACKQHMMQDHELIVYEGAGMKAVDHEAAGMLPQEPEQLTNHEASTGFERGKDKQLVPATGKRKVQMPRTLEREYWLTKKAKRYNSTPNDDKLKCGERACQYKFSTEDALHIHVSCHAAGGAEKADVAAARRVFGCCVCGERFERWCGCALHLWKAHAVDAGLLSCPVCHTYKTVTAVKLENHIKIHGEVRAYTCPDCGKGFKQSSQLRNHRVMHLDRRAGPVPRWYASKRCDICFKSYADSKCLKKHIQAVHSKLRPYVCQVCGHASARKAMLQMHLRQHTGEKPYGCTLCEYRTGDHNSLRRHTMRHTGQRPYRCPHCDYSAIQSSSYKNHLRSKHPGMQGLFSCTQCSFRTISQEGFLQHVSDHKNGLISSAPPEAEIEVFPGNVAAAHLIYRCLNALSTDGSPLQANLTGSATSEDGTTQTITIQIPTQQQEGGTEVEDDETAPCFLAIQEEEEEGVDTGGITIPAEPDPDPVVVPDVS